MVNDGATCRARSWNSMAACARSSGGTGQERSPSTPRGSRLVARMRSAGQSASSRSARLALAAARCSQLSSTSSTGPPPASPRAPRWAAMAAAWSVSWVSGTPSVAATAGAMSCGSVSGASSTQATSVGRPPAAPLASGASAAASLVAAASASRVLPAPPGPVSVSMRHSARARVTSPSSVSRPTSGVSRTGSVPVVSTAMCEPARSASAGWPVCQFIFIHEANQSRPGAE